MDGTEEVAEEQKRSSTFQVQFSASSSSEGGGGAEERYSSSRPSNFEIDCPFANEDDEGDDGEEEIDSFAANPMHGGGVRIFSPEVTSIWMWASKTERRRRRRRQQQEQSHRSGNSPWACPQYCFHRSEGESEGKRPGLQRLSTERGRRVEDFEGGSGNVKASQLMSVYEGEEEPRARFASTDSREELAFSLRKGRGKEANTSCFWKRKRRM